MVQKRVETGYWSASLDKKESEMDASFTVNRRR